MGGSLGVALEMIALMSWVAAVRDDQVPGSVPSSPVTIVTLTLTVKGLTTGAT